MAPRLSVEALLLVLVCLVLGTLVLAQTSVRAFPAAGFRKIPSACIASPTCAVSFHPEAGSSAVPLQAARRAAV